MRGRSCRRVRCSWTVDLQRRTGAEPNFAFTAFSEVATWQTRLLLRACYHVEIVEPGPGEHPGTMGREREGKHA